MKQRQLKRLAPGIKRLLFTYFGLMCFINQSLLEAGWQKELCFQRKKKKALCQSSNTDLNTLDINTGTVTAAALY